MAGSEGTEAAADFGDGSGREKQLLRLRKHLLHLRYSSSGTDRGTCNACADRGSEAYRSTAANRGAGTGTNGNTGTRSDSDTAAFTDSNTGAGTNRNASAERYRNTTANRNTGTG